jgi:tyrosyl-tRNA synthetase
MKKNVLTELRRRGFIQQISDDGLEAILGAAPATVYAGFDPTAPSLHVGHLLPVMALAHFQRLGHKVIALVGGATGMIGDPSGRSSERNLQTPDVIAENLEGLKRQMSLILDFTGDNPAVMVDNNDWIGRMSFVDWLREVGKHFSIGYMLGKESVKGRMEKESGISYTEFSYMTMQAYDFMHLHREMNCNLQCGGNDQWGNITAGIDLVRRKCGNQVYGLTFPLLTTANGEKFGKSAGNAVWLDAQKTSPYKFYQFWVQTSDADVQSLLNYFTFLEHDEIAQICEAHRQAPEKRLAQKRLAAEATRMIHGEDALKRVESATEALFQGRLKELTAEAIEEVFADVPQSEIESQRLQTGMPVLDLVVESGLCSSKGDARRAINAGSIYLNDQKVQADTQSVNKTHLIAGRAMILRRGKKDYHLVRVTNRASE